jgi:hypothetical protein
MPLGSIHLHLSSPPPVNIRLPHRKSDRGPTPPLYIMLLQCFDQKWVRWNSHRSPFTSARATSILHVLYVIDLKCCSRNLCSVTCIHANGTHFAATPSHFLFDVPSAFCTPTAFWPIIVVLPLRPSLLFGLITSTTMKYREQPSYGLSGTISAC